MTTRWILTATNTLHTRFQLHVTTRLGFTLVEAIIVVVILSVLAAVVLPSFTVIETKRFEQTISEIRHAIEFSQSMAQTTNTAYGVHFRVIEQDIRVYRVDISGASPVRIYDVRHPISKNIYTLQLSSTDNPTVLDNTDIKYDSINKSDFLEFAASSGIPQFNDSGVPREIKKADVTIILGDIEQVIEVSDISGRVTLKWLSQFH